MQAPQNPAGAFVPEQDYAPSRRAEFIADLARAPALLREAVAGLSEGQLDECYRNWTIRQIVHHLADSHLNSYVRFKWTLTQDQPTIKAYNEGRWAALEDSRRGDIQPPLALLEGLHGCWVQMLWSLTEQQYTRSFTHPETGKSTSLNAALCYYAWHCKHHTAQITWLREQRGW